jgi:hypothetical protein
MTDKPPLRMTPTEAAVYEFADLAVVSFLVTAERHGTHAADAAIILSQALAQNLAASTNAENREKFAGHFRWLADKIARGEAVVLDKSPDKGSVQ